VGYRRIDPDRRAAILAAIEARDGRSRAQLARDFEVSPRTVQRIADDAGIESPWDTTGTRQATAAARDHLRARRAALSARFLEEADRLLDKMHGPFVVFAFGGRDNEFNSATLAEPPTADLRNLMTSAAVAFDKHLAADKHDADAGEDDAVSMLGRLAEGLAAAHRQLSAAPADDESDDDAERG
jgi:hypothetical protein